MGTVKIGQGVDIDVDTLILTRLLVTANSGGGKSYLTRVLLELLRPKVQEIVIDAEDEFSSLREKFDFAHIGEGGEAAMDVRSAGLLAERLLEHRISAVCNLYEVKAHLRPIWVKNFIDALMNSPKKLWHPVIIALDEAQMFAPEGGKAESFNAVVDLATRGRKRGFCLVACVQRLADLSKKVTAQLLNRLVGPTFEDVDIDRAIGVLSIAKADQAKFVEEIKILEPGNFYALGRAISKTRILFKVRSAQTTHPEPGKVSKIAVPELPPHKLRDLLPKLADLPKAAEERQKTVAELQAQIRRLEAEARAKPAPAAAAPAKPSIQVKPQIVEVPVLSAAQAKELHKLAEKIEKYKGDLGWTSQRLEMAAAAIRSSVATVSDSVDKADRIRKAAPAPPPRAPLPIKPHAPRPAAEGDVKLLAGERKMLQVLAQFSPGTRTKSQLGSLSGYTPSGGTFGTYLSTLRKNGLITEDMGGSLKITEEGFAALGGDIPPAPSSPDALLEMWRSKLLMGERKMLDALVEAYPNSMTRQELGERTGYSADGGTFGTYLSTLRRNGLAVVAKDDVKASETLFELQNV